MKFETYTAAKKYWESQGYELDEDLKPILTREKRNEKISVILDEPHESSAKIDIQKSPFGPPYLVVECGEEIEHYQLRKKNGNE